VQLTALKPTRKLQLFDLRRRLAVRIFIGGRYDGLTRAVVVGCRVVAVSAQPVIALLKAIGGLALRPLDMRYPDAYEAAFPCQPPANTRPGVVGPQ
jgi:hypothetical protein